MLTWTSSTSDLTPEGTIVIDSTIAAGDTLYSEIKLSSQNWTDISPTSHVITPDEDVADSISLGLSALAAGSYDWRVRLLRASDGLYSNYSNIESKTLIQPSREFAALAAYINSAVARQYATSESYIVETV